MRIARELGHHIAAISDPDPSALEALPRLLADAKINGPD